jgi:C1A family cysteine protease
MKHIFGWHRDLPDYRDLKYKTVHKYNIQDLPSFVDLRLKCSPVENQDQLGSCTSFSLAGALEFLEEQSLVSKSSSPEILTPNSYSTFSHLFIYYNERDAEGDVNEDGGGQLRDGIKTLATLGCCAESIWLYDESKVFVKPSEEAYMEAKNHTITSYLSLSSISDMKHTLAEGFPFCFGFTVYEGFESPEVASTGILQMPTPEESCVGGHAVLAVGYNDAEQMFIIRNSWGSDWGLQGYFKMPYQYIVNPNLVSDFWTIRR